VCRSCGEIWDVECPIGRALCLAQSEQLAVRGLRRRRVRGDLLGNLRSMRERCWLTATSPSRIADAITRFAGSMPFVYVHMIWFTAWIALGLSVTPTGYSR
jgi:uncharacterized membrane protein